MTKVSEVLRQNGPQTAQQLSILLKEPIETVYARLVSAEAQELVRVNLDFKSRRQVDRVWEAM